MNILIADEDKINRKVLKYVFSKFENLSVKELANNEDIFDECAKIKYDLIFFSVTFASNPTWIISQLKQIDKNMFLIASSKSWDSDTIHKMLKAGAKDYIMQPFNTYVLKRRIENYLKIIRSAKIFEYGIKPINAFSKPCLPYYTTFKISHEHDLAYFWEHLNMVHINS